MLNVFAAIGSLISKPIQAYQKKQLLKQAQKFELLKLDHQANVANANAALEMAKQGQQQVYDLDRIAMQNMEKSWKDELILVIFLTPMVLAFIPEMDKYVKAGFVAIDSMPDWYVGLVIGLVVVIYGLRGLLRAFISNKLSKLIK